MTKCDIEHSDHPISREDYYSNAHVKKLNPDDFDNVKMLSKTKAKPRIIADLKSQKTGNFYLETFSGSKFLNKIMLEPLIKLLVVPNCHLR